MMFKPLFYAGLMISVMSLSARAEPKKVEIVAKPEGGWNLLRDGEPYYIKGAGGYGRLEELKAVGGNSLRIWNSEDRDWVNVSKLLDQADSLDLSVMLGLELIPARSFDYADEKKCDAQVEHMRKVVRQRRDHPALLLWAVGNEVEWAHNKADDAVWRGINRIAEMVKQEDPTHPTVIVLAGYDAWKIEAVIKHCPNIDILGINAYGDLSALDQRLKDTGWTKPVIVTEFGDTGWWSSKKLPWKAIKESTSTVKAAGYDRAYRTGVADRPNVLGSYAFIWGNKEEATFTYFGMFLESGEMLGAVNVMQKIWTSKKPDSLVPQIVDLNAAFEDQIIEPESVQKITLNIEFSLQAKPAYEWWLATDTSGKTFSGDPSENRAAKKLKVWKSDEASTEFTAPKESGAYRLYAIVRDGQGGAATASIAFFVK